MNNITEPYVDEKSLLHRIKFTLMLVLEIGSISISLLVFIFFAKHRAILRAPQYHVLSVLLVTNFIQLVIDMPFPLHFYNTGYVNPANPIFCTWWTFIGYTLFSINEYLVAFMSLQRHILIFKRHIMVVRRKHVMLCELPTMLCIIYPVAFYTCAILLYNCDGQDPWDYTNDVCGNTGCYLKYNEFLGTYDWVVNNGFPIVFDAIANVVLILRVIIAKCQRQREFAWRQQRNMIKQLLGVSILFIIGWTPSLIVGVFQIFVNPNFLAEINSDYFLDLLNMPSFLLPWMVLGLIPELKKWIKLSFRRVQRQNAIAVAATVNRRTIKT